MNLKSCEKRAAASSFSCFHTPLSQKIIVSDFRIWWWTIVRMQLHDISYNEVIDHHHMCKWQRTLLYVSHAAIEMRCTKGRDALQKFSSAWTSNKINHMLVTPQWNSLFGCNPMYAGVTETSIGFNKCLQNTHTHTHTENRDNRVNRDNRTFFFLEKIGGNYCKYYTKFRVFNVRPCINISWISCVEISMKNFK